jgi:hypothetical protein
VKRLPVTSIDTRGFNVTVLISLCLLASLKNVDLIHFAAPYFEDGTYLFGPPRFDPSFSVFTPMGGGYVSLFPRMFAVVVATHDRILGQEI